MADRKPSSAPMAGGFILTIGVIGGALIGAYRGQSTLGFLIGLGLSAAIVGAIWLKDRGR